LLYAFCLPAVLFEKPTSTVITSRDGELLGALIADDGQWRFPPADSIPERFKNCLLLFEDEHFYYHPGFNPLSMGRALANNLNSENSLQGGSTITQQVIRMSRGNPPRSYLEKLKELVLATRLELRHSKEEIIGLWANNAPYGGNVVGLEAASWRYFNRSPEQLSWAESATLAVLPNAPSLIFPGRNHSRLLEKRNRLLNKLMVTGKIDSLSYELALVEPLPKKPHRLPENASHVLQRIHIEQRGKRVQLTIDTKLQSDVNDIASHHHGLNAQNGINNLAVVVMDVKSKEVLAYLGNSRTSAEHQKDVDIITKPRSTGSILKPLLYAGMLDAGNLLPRSLVVDIPTQIGSYRPENFDNTYEGVVPANQALARSLNIPAIRMLRDYGIDRFHNDLIKNGFSHINRPADDYGLSIILGGAEASLWDICKNYAAIAGTYNSYSSNQAYRKHEWDEPKLIFRDNEARMDIKEKSKIRYSAAASHFTLESLKNVKRPNINQGWQYFENAQQVAWKTGTSFGFRDAWAVGLTSNYLVGVWVGNADGEGRPGLVGIDKAAPLMFDVFDLLPESTWPDEPFDELHEANICTESGFLAGNSCSDSKIEYVTFAGLETQPCRFHKTIHVDHQELYQVNRSCSEVEHIKPKSWFVLPPEVEYYYSKNHPEYKSLPPFKSTCMIDQTSPLAIIYPAGGTTVYLPKMLDGKKGEVVLKATHKESDATLFWYLDKEFIGATQTFHELTVQPDKGNYVLTVVDGDGNIAKTGISIID
jgi:penicillin-binding protein 1C